jgi:hypothetical protein
MRRILAIFSFLLTFTVFLFPQKTVKVKGSAQVEFPDHITRQDVKAKAEEAATIDALERAFGRIVIQGNTTYISNVQTGQQTETKATFNTIANTSVKGEVVRVLNVEFTDVAGTRTTGNRKETYIEIRCDIELEAREVTTPPVNFTFFPLKCTNEECRSTEFRQGEFLYLFFSTPSSGYLSVYLDDNGLTQCLYPYDRMPAEYEGGVPVKADKKYILFSTDPEFNYFGGKKYLISKYELFTNETRAINRLFVIFSKAPLNKPYLDDVTKDALGRTLPKSLKSEDFQRWLNRYRSFEKANAEVDYIDITITR